MYQVKAGDRLTRIAEANGTTTGRIISDNAFLIGRPVSLENLPTIYPGDRLNIFPPVKPQPAPFLPDDPSRYYPVNPPHFPAPAVTGDDSSMLWLLAALAAAGIFLLSR